MNPFLARALAQLVEVASTESDAYRFAMRPAILLVVLAACPSTPTTPDPQPLSALQRLNADARVGAVTETIHGVEVADPYRALESESELTTRWVEAQTERTRDALPLDPAVHRRLQTLMAIGSLSSVEGAGDRVFYERQDGSREQPLYVVQDSAVRDDGHGEVYTLIDPTDFGERAALDWAYPSPDGKLLAFGISQNGDERSVLHLLDVDARMGDPEAGLRELRIPRTKWCNFAWLHDGSGFYYSRYPKPDEPGFDPESEDTYFPRIFFHEIGSNPDEDPRVFGSETGTDFPTPSVSRDGRWLVINVFRGWSASDVYLYDRSESPAPQQRTTVIADADALTGGYPHDGKLYLFTNLDAPRYRIATTPLERPASSPAGWTDVVPQRDATMDSFVLSGDAIAAHYIDDIRSRLLLFDLDGENEREVELPARGSIGHLSGEPGEPRLRFDFDAYLRPPSIVEVVTSTRQSRELNRIRAEFDFEPYTSRLVHVRSADGTQVPVTLLHRRGFEPDGNAPVLLYGYGGFNISLLPGLRRNALYWLERGGVYAVANLRGGGEMGEAWHRDGMLANKQHVFEDFEAVITWLGGDSGISTPERIAITGGSNGGLLMGAMLTRVPERFGAVASYVGLYDMVRYHRFPPAELWVSEYGSAEDAEQFRVLHAYSPYHHVVADTRYPSTLIETADHDSRVHWAHSTKFTAALQEANASDRPIYFWMSREQGHGAGTRLSDTVQQYARMYTFFERELGMR